MTQDISYETPEAKSLGYFIPRAYYYELYAFPYPLDDTDLSPRHLRTKAQDISSSSLLVPDRVNYIDPDCEGSGGLPRPPDECSGCEIPETNGNQQISIYLCR
ncbi:hypothetical protein CEXT_523441 [Caerostris extrusa]|uniref:Uncharacterized protein n=1 Tax=Caerostris extrusa TaxID=172846 RepID=A0AAV4N8P1_CAEEX|nr:hypothetical protein CEXT_523441 [Caerostris extrusa]